MIVNGNKKKNFKDTTGKALQVAAKVLGCTLSVVETFVSLYRGGVM